MKKLILSFNNNEQGFTLIELIIVIAILAILAVAAAPRFIDIKTDANAAAMKQIAADVKHVTNMVYAKAIIQGLNVGDQTIQIYGDSLDLLEGYPNNGWNNSMHHLVLNNRINSWTQIDECLSELCGVGGYANAETDNGTISMGGVLIWPKGYSTNDKCSVHYRNSGDGAPPNIIVSTSGC